MKSPLFLPRGLAALAALAAFPVDPSLAARAEAREPPAYREPFHDPKVSLAGQLVEWSSWRFDRCLMQREAAVSAADTDEMPDGLWMRFEGEGWAECSLDLEPRLRRETLFVELSLVPSLRDHPEKGTVVSVGGATFGFQLAEAENAPPGLLSATLMIARLEGEGGGLVWEPTLAVVAVRAGSGDRAFPPIGLRLDLRRRVWDLHLDGGPISIGNALPAAGRSWRELALRIHPGEDSPMVLRACDVAEWSDSFDDEDGDGIPTAFEELAGSDPRRDDRDELAPGSDKPLWKAYMERGRYLRSRGSSLAQLREREVEKRRQRDGRRGSADRRGDDGGSNREKPASRNGFAGEGKETAR